MITDTGDQIIEYIRYHGQARVHDLQKSFNLSHVAIHKQLKKLLESGLLVKVGKPPLVFYTLPPATIVTDSTELTDLTDTEKQIIDTNFLSITPDGTPLNGISGFIYRANNYQKNKSILTSAREYVSAVQKQQEVFKPQGLIDATEKIKNTFKDDSAVDRLFFQELYSYPVYGRTKLAKLVMYAKQTGNKELINQIVTLARPVINQIINKYKIDAVGFIPPTVPRPVQFMAELRSDLALNLPEIDLVKVISGAIPIPQKTLPTVEERVINAKNSIFLKDVLGTRFKNVLLIDDVAGSSASLNETAKKLKAAKIGSQSIIAFSLVGNIKGHEVVREI